ncbi:MAG: PLP-dependent aminotransferase family protein [Desulfovibrio sp.]|uniref:MocR-like pyridoxine biosynthesis transcription factor PdxR n=1 Tax=Desulfovibrio sp. TaxID=885 RepID=UPI0039E24681
MLKLDAASNMPLFQQIYCQIRADILSGARPEGTRLPSLRAMSKEMQLGKNTIESAYAQLALEGYIAAIPGSGYKVNPIYGLLHQIESNPTVAFSLSGNDHAQKVNQHYRYNFSYENSDGSTFPNTIWRKLTSQILTDDAPASGYSTEMHSYGDAAGYLPLRHQLASYLYRSRGVRCTAEQVVICSGLQPSIMSILRLLQGECNIIALEDPGYHGARAVYECFNTNTIAVPVNGDGLDLAVLVNSSARVAHIAPSHQFPTGVVMPISKRMEILSWAIENESFIIEDDYDSELRYSGRPIPSMQSIDTNGRVIYLGTFSKVLSPGLRMSYMVLPPLLYQRFCEIFSGFQCTVPWLEQAVLTRFMANGLWERHLRKICLQKKKKHDVFVNTVNQLWGERAIIHGHNAGLHILLEFTDGASEKELVSKAALSGIKVYPASNLWKDKALCPKNCLFMGYGMLSESDIVSALKVLKAAWC